MKFNLAINIIFIIVIIGIGITCKLAMDALLSLSPFSNTPEEKIISIATGVFVSFALFIARFKHFKI